MKTENGVMEGWSDGPRRSKLAWERGQLGRRSLGGGEPCPLIPKIGCRRSLPWSAAVLCRFEDGIHDLVKYVWPLSAGSKVVEDYRNPRRYCDRPRSAGFSRVWLRGVAPGCSLLRLVAATGKKFEEESMKREISSSQREIQDAGTALWAACVALCRIICDGSADSLFVALAEVGLVRPVLVSANARDGRAAGLSRLPMSLPNSVQVSPAVSPRFSLFHLVSAIRGKNRKGRLKTHVFSYEERTCSRSLQTANTPPRPFHLRESWDFPTQLLAIPFYPTHSRAVPPNTPPPLL